YFAFCTAAAIVIAAAARRRAPGGALAAESAVTGTVQAFALACGLLFVSLYKGFLGGTTTLLFGSFLGITTGQVTLLAVVAVITRWAVTWSGLIAAFYSPYPIGFWITSFAFGAYLAAHLVAYVAVRLRWPAPRYVARGA